MSNGPELLVLDTSTVSLLRFRRHKPRRLAHWPAGTLERLDAAVLAISFATAAEIDAGLRDPRLDTAYVTSERRRLAALPVLPLDQPTMDTWAELFQHLKSQGRAMGQHDLWIAATAKVRAATVVTADTDFLALVDQVGVLYLPRNADSRPG